MFHFFSASLVQSIIESFSFTRLRWDGQCESAPLPLSFRSVLYEAVVALRPSFLLDFVFASFSLPPLEKRMAYLQNLFFLRLHKRRKSDFERREKGALHRGHWRVSIFSSIDLTCSVWAIMPSTLRTYQQGESASFYTCVHIHVYVVFVYC